MTTDKEDAQKLTHADALAQAREGERVEFSNCPHCNEIIAIYISAAVSGNTVPVKKADPVKGRALAETFDAKGKASEPLIA